MADNTNFSQYAFDPYQAEEDEIKSLEARMVAQALRGRTRNPGINHGGWLVGGDNFADRFNKARDLRQAQTMLDNDIPQRRRALSQRVQDDYTQAAQGAGASPEVQSLLSSPATRQMGLAELSKDRARTRSKSVLSDTLGALNGGSGQPGQPGQVPDVAQLRIRAMAMAANPDPEVQALGKVLLEQLKQVELDKGVRHPLTGQVGMEPGQLEGLSRVTGVKEVERARYDPHTIMQGDRPTLGSKLEAAGYPRDYNPVGGPAPGGMSPSSPPAPGAAPNSPTGGPSPVSGGAPGPGAMPGNGGPHSVQELQMAFQAAVSKGDMVEASRIGSTLAQMGIKVDASAVPRPGTELARLPNGQGTYPAQQQPSPQQPAKITGPITAANLPDYFGAPPNPATQYARGQAMSEGEKLRQSEGIKNAAQEIQTLRKNAPKDRSNYSTLHELDKINKEEDLITGPLPGPALKIQRGMNNLGIGWFDPRRISASEFYDKLNLTQLKESLSAFGSGTGISNLDLMTAERSLPGRENTPEGRQKIIDYMMGGALSNIVNLQAAEAYYAKWGHLSGFQYQHFDKDGNLMTQDRMRQELEMIKRRTELEKRTPKLDNPKMSILGDVAERTGDLSLAYGAMTNPQARALPGVAERAERGEQSFMDSGVPAGATALALGAGGPPAAAAIRGGAGAVGRVLPGAMNAAKRTKVGPNLYRNAHESAAANKGNWALGGIGGGYVLHDLLKMLSSKD